MPKTKRGGHEKLLQQNTTPERGRKGSCISRALCRCAVLYLWLPDGDNNGGGWQAGPHTFSGIWLTGLRIYVPFDGSLSIKRISLWRWLAEHTGVQMCFGGIIVNTPMLSVLC